MLEENKSIVRSFVDAINAKDWLRVYALLASNFTRHSAAAGEPAVRSAKDLVEFLQAELVSFPDASEVLLDLVAEGDKVAARHQFRGTQLGPLGTFPPTGKVLQATYITIYRIENQRIAEAWAEWDNLAGLKQLGHANAEPSPRAVRPLAPMLEVNLSVALGSAAEKVWEVTGDFNALPKWHPWVESSVLESAAGGVGRRVTNVGGTAGRRELTERLVYFDAEAREYAYTIISGPAPFVDYVGRFRVLARGANRCVFEFASRFRAAPGKTDAEARERVQTFYEAGLANLPRIFGTW